MIVKKKAESPDEENAQLKQLIEEVIGRLGDLEAKGMQQAAFVHLMNLLYLTDPEHLPELSRIPLTAVEPMAIETMLDKLSDPDVRSGKVSLVEVLHTSYLKLMRSVGGEHLNKGRELAAEQASNEAQQKAELPFGED